MQKIVTQKHSLWNIVSQHHYSINPPYFPLHFLESRSVFAWMIMTNACLNLVIETVIIMVIWSYGFQDFFSFISILCNKFVELQEVQTYCSNFLELNKHSLVRTFPQYLPFITPIDSELKPIGQSASKQIMDFIWRR